MVPYLRTAFAAARPVIACMVLIVGEVCRSVFLCTGQDVMLIRFIVTTFDRSALFVQGRPLENIGADVEIVEVVRNDLVAGIVPRSDPDPLTCKDASLISFFGAEVWRQVRSPAPADSASFWQCASAPFSPPRPPPLPMSLLVMKTFTGGTGKYTGIQGESEYTQFRGPLATEGVWTSMGIVKGNYKLP